MLLVAKSYWQLPARELLDPTETIVAEGDYAVAGVTSAAAVDLIVPDEPQAGVLRVGLLGISFAKPAAAPRTMPLTAAVRRIQSYIGDGCVRVRFDRRRLNPAGELQAYVFVDDLLINEELVREGLATDATHPSDSGRMVRRIKLAEQLARQRQRGIWRPAVVDTSKIVEFNPRD
jgi:micrococcal nuclease